MIKLPKEIIEFYKKNQDEIYSKLTEFKSVPEDKYFYEMVYCLCTPMSKAENAMVIQQILENMDFFNNPLDPSHILRNPKHYIRFHNYKAKYILKNRDNFNNIIETIKLNKNIFEKRSKLIEQVSGFGMKEASHFLRNIGQFGLPILDRHILRTMMQYGVVNEIPISINKKKYEILERIYIDWCNYNKFTVEEMDLVLWKLATGKILK